MPTIGEATTPGCLAGSSIITAAVSGAAVCSVGAGVTWTFLPPNWRRTRMRWSPCSISISVSPVSSRSLASSRIAPASIAGLNGLSCGGRATASVLRPDGDGGQTRNRQRVTGDAEAADDPLRHLGDHRIVPEALARMDIGDVHLHHGQRGGDNGVENGDRGGGIAGRVDHDPGGLFRGSLLNPVDQLPFVIRLAE